MLAPVHQPNMMQIERNHLELARLRNKVRDRAGHGTVITTGATTVDNHPHSFEERTQLAPLGPALVYRIQLGNVGPVPAED
jgi:hypothetical protein